LNAHCEGKNILIDLEDRGNGLPPGTAGKMFQPFTQGGEDKRDMGLGLTISRRSVEASDGNLRVINKPHSACVFSIDLPWYSMPVTDGISG